MLSQFEREPNIAVLNLERDLKDALPEVMYQENYSADLNLMDYLRRSNQASAMCSLCCATRPRRHTAVSGNRGRRSLIVDFHRCPHSNPDQRRVENHTPIFMQLLPLMAMGETGPGPNAELTERMTRIYPSACGRGLR
ncbi:hypothetical protein Q5P01_000082 [Channa striata]|uniref:Uncharacterized protein n=1 Tax=Channa striata TaxID=64152 RepID=A0AA88IJ83_CHASR|nr:hypothetical protein Q5P01_000082 [Channa striata]